LISSITGIQRQALIGFSKERRFSVAQMMSWASKRTTTRIEDIAYCLLGIFDVNMPLLYGEGEKAFHRLQLEIMKERDDESIFAWDVPKIWTGASELGMLAKHPSAFQNASDHHSTPSLRQYSMSNKGIQMKAKLLQMRDVLQEKDVLAWQPAVQRPEWFLVLGCNQGNLVQRRLAISVKQDPVKFRDGNVFVRSSPGLFSLPEAILEKLEAEAEWRDVFLVPLVHHDEQVIPRDLSVLLDIRSAIQHGYSVEQINQTQQEYKSLAEGLIKIQLERGCNPIFLSFGKELDNFIFVLSTGGGVRLVLQMFSEKSRSRSGDGVGLLLPSGKYATAIMKKKIEGGRLVHTIELLIMENGALYNEINGGTGQETENELLTGDF
jgi:hypothetical protein